MTYTNYQGRALKKEKHVIRKIRIKKAYEKIKKQEGYTDDSITQATKNENSEDKKTEISTHAARSARNLRSKIIKSDPFAKSRNLHSAIQKAWEEKQSQRQVDMERQDRERQAAKARRAEETTLMRAKNSKGQPKLGQQISVLLGRIQRQ